MPNSNFLEKFLQLESQGKDIINLLNVIFSLYASELLVSDMNEMLCCPAVSNGQNLGKTHLKKLNVEIVKDIKQLIYEIIKYKNFWIILQQSLQSDPHSTYCN
uniref:Uncharacterized protein n=1 Tax=Cacopsylla melanoneura TaxID=428564 RepID=A0A8D8SVZ1_9HEMI